MHAPCVHFSPPPPKSFVTAYMKKWRAAMASNAARGKRALSRFSFLVRQNAFDGVFERLLDHVTKMRVPFYH